MTKTVFGILMVVVGIGGFALTPVLIKDANDDAKQLKSAVYVGDSGIQEENEGKLVIVTGELKITSPAYDSDKNLEFPTLHLSRSAEKASVSVKYDKKLKKEVNVYEWHSHSSENGEFLGQGTIGDYQISESFAKRLPLSKYSDYDPAVLEKSGLYLYDTATDYLTDMKWKNNEFENGAVRYHYLAYQPKDMRAVTLFGIQQGNELTANGKICYGALDGILSHKAVMKAKGKANRRGVIVCIVIALISFFGGIAIILSEWKDMVFWREQEKEAKWKGRD